MDASETRLSWTCAECSVASRRPEVGAVPMPTGWTVADDRLLCLSCARRDAGMTRGFATRSAKATQAKRAAREVRHAAIRDALADLAPAQGRAPLEEVAAATGTSRSTVDQVRRDMRAAGELPPGEPGRPRRDGADAALRRSAAASALKADPGKPDAEIAAEIGVPPKAVARARKKLGLPSSAEARAKRTGTAVAAALAGRPTGATVREIAEASDRSFKTTKCTLDDLVALRRATVLQRGHGQGALYTPTGD